MNLSVQRPMAALLILLSALILGRPAPAHAEASTLRIAQQYGISYLPMMLMQRDRLVEKQARAAGLGEVTVEWSKFAGANVMNDALLSNSLDIASAGAAPAILVWGKTKGQIRLVSAMNSIPNFLNSRNPEVKTIADLTDKDKIALPSVKVGFQPIVLQMAAEKVFGKGQQNRLDALTVSLAHPDGMAALLSGGEVTAHFTSPPFQYQELKTPGVHTILNSYDVVGPMSTFNVMYSTKTFHDANPKLYKAFLAAFQEAVDSINRDKRAAAQAYVDISKDKTPVDEIYAMVADPQVEFTMTPRSTMVFADFLYRTGAIKDLPKSWKEMYFPEIHHLQGS